MTRRNKFEKFMKAVYMAGKEKFPYSSHEREFIDEGLQLMREMMDAVPAFDDSRETQEEVVDRLAKEFCDKLDKVGVGVEMKIIYK